MIQVKNINMVTSDQCDEHRDFPEEIVDMFLHRLQRTAPIRHEYKRIEQRLSIIFIVSAGGNNKEIARNMVAL